MLMQYVRWEPHAEARIGLIIFLRAITLSVPQRRVYLILINGESVKNNLAMLCRGAS